MIDPHAYGRAMDTLDYLMGVVEAEAFARQSPSTSTETLPVVLVTGFLGAGKTTLMQRLLLSDHGLKIAAVVNDLANLNIDAAIVADAGAKTLSLSNGCICCSQAGGVAKALAEISAWPEPPDLVLLEASGVADPTAIAGAIDTMQAITLQTVITVVDAARPIEDDPLIERGVRAADLILLNKTDLIAPILAANIEQSLIELAPKAACIRTVDCAIPPSLIFDPWPRTRPDGLPSAPTEDEFETIELSADGPVDQCTMERMLATMPARILRVKGILAIADGPPKLLQAVGRRWRWSDAGEIASGHMGRLVIIARSGSDDVVLHFSPVLGSQ
jgi:G3E family GTPase